MRKSYPWVRIVSVHRHNSDINSLFTLQATGCNFQFGPNFGVHSDPTFRFRCFFVSRQSVLTTGHCIWELWELQHLLSWNTVRLQQQSGILHPYTICSIRLVVITFQLVLHIFAIVILCEHGHHYSKAHLSWSHSARTRNSTVLPQRVFPRDRIHILYTFLRLHRKLSLFAEVIVRKTVVIVSWLGQ